MLCHACVGLQKTLHGRPQTFQPKENRENPLALPLPLAPPVPKRAAGQLTLSNACVSFAQIFMTLKGLLCAGAACPAALHEPAGAPVPQSELEAGICTGTCAFGRQDAARYASDVIVGHPNCMHVYCCAKGAYHRQCRRMCSEIVWQAGLRLTSSCGSDGAAAICLASSSCTALGFMSARCCGVTPASRVVLDQRLWQ